MNEEKYSIEDIEETKEQIIHRKLNHITFCRVLLYLNLKLREENDFIYASDLAKFLKVSTTRAYQILRVFENLGLVERKRITSNFTEFHPTINQGEIVLKKYVKKAMKTLGLI